MSPRRSAPFTVAALLLLPLAASTAAAPDLGAPPPRTGAGGAGSEPPQLVITYGVDTSGTVHSDVDTFAETASAILSDDRGWTLGGSIAFEPVPSGGDLTLILAAPDVVEDAAPVCSRRYSCRVGDRIYINDVNWRDATPAWNRTGAPLRLYRQYLINHEVGHYLGEGHHDCSGHGQAAPVMQQQSISLDGCEPNGWPLEVERERVADRYAIASHDVVLPDAVAPGRAAAIAEAHDAGTYRPLAF